MTDPLHRSIRVHCAVTHAFAVFTDQLDLWWPKGHRRFTQSQLVLEARVGGRFVERSDSGEEAKLGQVVHCEPPHRISYIWHPGAVKEPTLVEVSFVDDGEHTIVNILHSEAESALGDLWPERVALFTKGWNLVLSGYQSYLEQESASPPAR